MIRRLTPVDQPELAAWYSRAVNDPTVAPWLNDGRWSSCPVIPDNDWEKTLVFGFEDSLLRVNYERDERAMGVTLHVLDTPRRALHSALMLRYVVKMARAAGFQYLMFQVSNANVAWLDQLYARHSRHCWGVRPFGFYDPKTHRPVSGHHFCVPVWGVAP